MLDQELEDRLERQIVSIGECDRETIAMHQLGEESKRGRGRHILSQKGGKNGINVSLKLDRVRGMAIRRTHLS